ncbi:MAG: hypothetical protein JWM99_925 [Verrucomicrobiales bacterium]|nr:hypothetical protein [Verrucomicrobiales bacterium]
MKDRSEATHPVVTNSESATSSREEKSNSQRRKRGGWRKFFLIFFVACLFAGTARAALPWFVRDYVNRALSRNPLYSGKIGEVQIHLWRGAYSIQNVRISKTTGSVPVPFFSAKTVGFAMEWPAILHHKLVGRVSMIEPQINFVDGLSDSEGQTGAGGPWLEMIRDLFPFKINSAAIKNGSIHFRAFKSQNQVDVYLSEVTASIDNLTNIRDETTPLVSTVQMTALAMDQAKFEFKMTLDPFSYRPTFHMATRLLGLDVTKINDLALAYGKFNFKRGWFDFVIEADAKEGQLMGYAKPLFRNLKVFALKEDVKEDTVVQFFWQALVGATTAILTNRSRDQFGTLIPFSSDMSGTTSAQLLTTIGNILRNAFIRAYLPRLENGTGAIDTLKFSAPEITDSISAGDSPQ